MGVEESTNGSACLAGLANERPQSPREELFGDPIPADYLEIGSKRPIECCRNEVLICNTAQDIRSFRLQCAEPLNGPSDLVHIPIKAARGTRTSCWRPSDIDAQNRACIRKTILRHRESLLLGLAMGKHRGSGPNLDGQVNTQGGRDAAILVSAASRAQSAKLMRPYQGV
jgi:hypothetical protein